MNIAKIALLILWILCTAIFLIGVLTPLDFTHRWIMYAAFFISLNGVFLLSFLLTDFISVKRNKVLYGLLASTALILTYEFSPKFGSGWKTQDIIYRQKNNPENIIAFQMEDVGAFGYNKRYVKIIPVTPLFIWVTELKKAEPGDGWIMVNEYVNELELKGG